MSTFTDFISGGYNMPTEDQISMAPVHKPEADNSHGGPVAWLLGGYNMPSEQEVNAASSVVIDRPTYPTGFWGWVCGGYNVPKFSHPKR